jgi:hypothetical protein
MSRPLKNAVFDNLRDARILKFAKCPGETQILVHTLPTDCVGAAPEMTRPILEKHDKIEL